MKLIPEWKSLWKSLSVQFALLGAAVPEILQVIANNTSLLPWLDDSVKNMIRLGFLVAIPVVRAIKQTSVSGT